MADIINRSTHDVRIRHEGTKVLVAVNGDSFMELEPHVAEQIGRAMIQVAKRADEVLQAERIAHDSAILMRAGAPFSLSSHPRILDAARVEAAWNPELRRQMSGGVKSREVFGLPTLIQSNPKEHTHG